MNDPAFNLAQVAIRPDWYDHLPQVEAAMAECARVERLRSAAGCTADDGGGATGVRTTQGSAACHSGSVTGTARDLATCVVVKVLLPSNSLIGPLDGTLCELPFLQHLDLSGNALTGSLPSAADCLPRLTYLDLTQTRSWDDEGAVAGPVPEFV